MLCLRFEDFLRILGTSTVKEEEEAERGVKFARFNTDACKMWSKGS